MRIGIFDSGIGGLTVVKEIIKELPSVDIVYVGDTARVPYGPRGNKTIIRYATQIVKYLLKQKVNIIIVACNTVSSVALIKLKKLTKIPIIGMIEPASDKALSVTRNNKIAVIGTKATIKSNAYAKYLKRKNKLTTVYSKACPLFVPIVEEGLQDDQIARLIAQKYLNNKSIDGSDTLIMGCTHYPLMLNTIKKILGKKVKLVTCGRPTASFLKKEYPDNKNQSRIGELTVFVTDDPENFKQKAGSFLGKNIKKIRLLPLEKLS